MIFSLSNKFIFCRVIKTASTSLADEFKNKIRPLEQSLLYKAIRRIPNFKNIYPFYDFYYNRHTSLAQAKSIIPENIFNECLKFGVVREPKSWIISVYKHWERTYKHTRDIKYSKNINSLEDFIYFRMDQYPPLQSLQFIGSNGDLLVDKVGNFHKLDEFSHELSFILGFNINPKVLNSSPKNQIISCSSKEESLIEKACELDYKLFQFDNINDPFIFSNVNLELGYKDKLIEAWINSGGINYDSWDFRRKN